MYLLVDEVAQQMAKKLLVLPRSRDVRGLQVPDQSYHS